MLHITPDQFRQLRADAERRYPAVLADHCERALGLAPAPARALSEHVVVLGRGRGLELAEDFEALAEVLAPLGPEHEPAWCREITQGAAAQKAQRLRACLQATRRD